MLSHDDLCYLSRVFNESRIVGVGIDRDTRINDWLKGQIMAARRREEGAREFGPDGMFVKS